MERSGLAFESSYCFHARLWLQPSAWRTSCLLPLKCKKKPRCCAKAPAPLSQACYAVLAATKRTAGRARVSLATVTHATVAAVTSEPFGSCCSNSRAEQERVRLQLRLRLSLSTGPTWLQHKRGALMPTDIWRQTRNVCSFLTDSFVRFSL